SRERAIDVGGPASTWPCAEATRSSGTALTLESTFSSRIWISRPLLSPSPLQAGARAPGVRWCFSGPLGTGRRHERDQAGAALGHGGVLSPRRADAFHPPRLLRTDDAALPAL